MLADTLRTDRIRLRPLTPDSPATVTLRRACRARKDLVTHRVAVTNQLREHLKRVFPAAVGLFADIDSPISLDLPEPLRLPRPRRLAFAQTFGRMAGKRRLLRKNRPRRFARPSDRCARGVVGEQAITEIKSPEHFWRFF